MRQGNSFDWRTLGKADYSQATALVASLPEEIRCKLDGVDKELAVRILNISWLFSEKSGRGVGYCWPTLSTLARYVGRSVRTVQRHLDKLALLGVVSWKRRTTSMGGWTSNLYQMGKTFMASIFARGKKKVQSFRDRTKVADNDLKREYKASAPVQRGERLTDFLMKIRAERQTALGAQFVGSAPTVGGQDEEGW